MFPSCQGIPPFALRPSEQSGDVGTPKRMVNINIEIDKMDVDPQMTMLNGHSLLLYDPCLSSARSNRRELDGTTCSCH